MKNKLPLYFFALLSVVVLFNSCKKEYESIQSIDDEKIQAYMKQNNYSMTKDPSGFYYQIITPGTGGTMQNTDSVLFDVSTKSITGTSYYAAEAMSNVGEYLGYMASPKTYKHSVDALPYPGTAFKTAVQNIQRGGKVRIVIPSYLAYGKNGKDKIPSNEVLVSEISVYNQTKQRDLDDDRIQAFITAKGIAAVKQPSRIYTLVNDPGSGTEVAELGSTMKVKFTGRLLTGVIFDQTTGDNTDERPLYFYIKGWQKALAGLKVGAKVRIFIPSDLAYGTAALLEVPQNSVLDFDVEIVNITN